MADWDNISGDGNVEDRRGITPLGLAGGGGLVVLLLTLGLNFLGLNVTPGTVSNVLTSIQSTQADPQTQPAEFQGKDSYEAFVSKVLGSTNEVWGGIFQKAGGSYEEPRLVLFRDATQTACGLASSSVGPFYCPSDRTIYLDDTFFEQLKVRFGGSTGDVAQAYVVAHEVGHNVQSQLGVLNDAASNSVETELQADCYAGVWAYAADREGVFTDQEVSQATDAAAAVGDDNIQLRTEGRVNPETWSHGSSEQRVQAFNTGYESGQPGACTDLAA